METAKLLRHIENLDFVQFQNEWNLTKNESTEKDRQKLLLKILDYHYHKANFSFFVKVFDEILLKQTSLDFNIDHWAPTFLSLSVQKSSKMLLQYFLRKGANVNFIGDTFSEYSQKEIENESENMERYTTCLDFANLKYGDMFSVDYNFSPPFYDIEERKHNENASDKITITKGHYFDLVEQSIYLQDLIHLDRVRDYIINSGGKNYEELQNK